MPGRPLVTVLISAHNDLRFLPEAVESIFAQTFDDYEFLIIDDGSTDGTRAYLDSLRDPRVRVLRNLTNVGLTPSLNRGLDAAAGEFVARIDADDVALPQRLARQVEFLRAHPEVAVCGSARDMVDERGSFVAHAPAAEDDLCIRWKCLLGNPFAHPTVMFRLDLLDEHGLRYDERCRTAQDYELWTRLLAMTRGANLREPLMKYRLREGVSRIHRGDQLRNHDRIALGAIRRLVPDFAITGREVTELRGRFGGHSVRDPAMDPADSEWVQKYRDLGDAFAARYGAQPAALAA
jgi:glycosyltransferase involved in cell wall biosynthesis